MDLGSATWPEAQAFSERGGVLVAPLGSFEQHGPHLPLLTDTLIVGEVARRAASALGEGATWLPTLWLGASPHHIGFCGTMTLQNDRYIGVVEDLLESALESGFRRILLLNGHGGNEAPARIAMYNVRFRRRAERGLHLALVSWWSLIPGAAPVRAGCVQAAVSHACEWETSALLALHPESVRADLAPDDSGPEPWPGAGTRRYVADEARQFAEVTVTGALGLPRQASASKGEALLSAAADALVELVRDISGWADTPQPHH